jgi:L-alanine-DL-glutamate epimerase-like enolase superfamily enzyme
MKINRRNFLATAAGIGVSAAIPFHALAEGIQHSDFKASDEALARPVLKTSLFSYPVIIKSLDLLRYKNNFICRVRSSDGAEGLSVGNNDQLLSLYPMFTHRLRPFFIGKNAIELEKLIDEVYVWQSNYKHQGLGLWIPLATIEFAILDMLGKIAGKPIGELIGDIHHPRVAVYQANGDRGKSAEETLELIRKDVEESSAKALKFKVGGRMSNNFEHPQGRTEKLIPLVRKAFGDEMVIYADSNGSYTVDEAIRIGKIMEEYRYDFYEEPVPFDWYEETHQVAKALKIPIAGGEQEPSMRNFRWLIGNQAIQIVQPDIFYFGGMIRSMKVARMAEAAGYVCTPHISGSGLGFLYMVHFVSALPNAGPYHEFKGLNKELPFNCSTSSLISEDGVIKVPTGPGLGIEIDPAYIAKHVQVTD